MNLRKAYRERARWSALSNYWLNNRLAVAELPEEPPLGLNTEYPDRAYPPLYADRHSYWIETSYLQNILTGQVLPPDAVWKQSITDFARGPLRPAQSVYWIPNLIDGNVPPEPPQLPPDATFKQYLTGSARDKEVAVRTAYWVDTTYLQNILTGQVLPLEATYHQFFPQETYAPKRADPDSYWIDNLLAVAEVVEVMPPGYLVIPSSTPDKPAVSSTIYWAPNLLSTPEAIVEEVLPAGYVPISRSVSLSIPVMFDLLTLVSISFPVSFESVSLVRFISKVSWFIPIVAKLIPLEVVDLVPTELLPIHTDKINLESVISMLKQYNLTDDTINNILASLTEAESPALTETGNIEIPINVIINRIIVPLLHSLKHKDE